MQPASWADGPSAVQIKPGDSSDLRANDPAALTERSDETNPGADATDLYQALERALAPGFASLRDESALHAAGNRSGSDFSEPALEPVAKRVPQHAQNIERRTQQRPAGEFRRRNRLQNIESLGCPRHGFDEHFAREGGDQHALT